MLAVKSTIGNKRAGVSIYLGVILMLIAFLVIAICINIFQMYSIDVRVQLICDVVADGSAIAGQTPLGFDEERTKMAADKIFGLNNTLSDAELDYEIQITDEVIDGSPTGNKLVSVQVFGRSNYFYTEILDFFDGKSDVLAKTFSVSAKSVVKAIVKTEITSVLTESYFEGKRYQLPTVGIITTTPGNRLASYSTWLIDYYLCPEYNPIYQPSSPGAAKSGHFLLDYLKHMGLYSEPFSAESILSGDGQSFFLSYIAAFDTNAASIQSKANAGEVMFFACRNNESGAAELYIVVPAKTNLDEGCIAVAYANSETNNYHVLKLDDFMATHSNVTFYHHD